ncbi:MAG: tetratricopeptide repeat protein [Bacteroidales bacterium]|nr:tetratricopeptide repeat protein [Bacteroidales bacterium]
MKIKIINVLVLLSALGLFSCQSLKKVSKVNQLSQEMQYRQSDLYTKAFIQKELGNLQEADSLMKMALAINPNDPAANFQEANLSANLGNIDTAMYFAHKAVTLDTINEWYKVLYANLAKANGNYKEYVNAYKKLVEQHPQNENFVQELGLAYFFTGDYKNAVKYYIDLESLVGVQPALSQKIVDLYMRLGEKTKALETYEKLIQSNPDDQRSYALMAEFAAKNGFPEKAEWAYHKILEVNPQNPYVHISLAEFYRDNKNPEKAFEELKMGFANPHLDVQTEINLLAAYYSGNLTDEQIAQALQLSIIIKKTHPESKLADALYASMLYQNKKYEEALPLLEKASKNDPNNYALQEQILFSHLYMQKFKLLEEAADTVISNFPDQPIPYLLGGIAAAQENNYKHARTLLERGKNLAAGNNSLLEQFYSSLGDTYNALKMNKESFAAYDSALLINPKNSLVLNNYAYNLALTGEQLEKAAQMADQAVKLDPYNQNDLDTYAWVLYKQKKYEEALQWEEKAINNGGSTSGVVVEHYGDILYQLGKHKEAIDQWKKAMKLKDHSDLLEKKLKTGKLYE